MTRADVYLANDDTPHAALARRRKVEVDGVGVWVAPPEYVILRRLEFYREGRSEKHLRDIRAMARRVAATARALQRMEASPQARG